MLITFTIIPYLHVTIINKCHYWKNIVLHIFCTRFCTCPKFVLRLQVAWWSVLSRSKTARYPTRIPTLLQNTGWLHILLAFEEIWHRSHWNWLLTKLTLIIKVVALTRMLANPKILEETGVRVVWPFISKILAILLLNDFRKKNLAIDVSMKYISKYLGKWCKYFLTRSASAPPLLTQISSAREWR